ncbi:FAD-dependent monooxygenase [Nonomuraea diastatica]|uniref:FAD-dependent oxidoreductase n=1 Tax=Nonomuraea diastatica TaxID=1848329 RepID=A0A4V2YD68_9ACTN|nr:FAD-dependent monooxygenase [Nonomuraea diastatica]TDD14096.1 FAD-dependent oxidoreductase [Nonomuraea diastatica]
MRILISGASVAGPVLAYWLHRYGFRPTVVERAPALRKTGGHAVDLFRPSMGIVEQMGLLKHVQAKDTGAQRVTLLREGAKAIRVDTARVLGVTPGRHVEIMRDDLSEIFYDATRHDVEYAFGDSIASIEDGEDEVKVTFERAEPRAFALVVGADGLHSNVRRLVFGEERQFTHFLGGYVSVATVPDHLGLSNEMISLAAPGRMMAMYSPRHLEEARATFMFHSPHRLDYHRHDTHRQKELLREHFAGLGSEAPRLLAELDGAPAFYFDEITQLRMETWSRGRVSLTGDAAYCPGPAVGASTSMAVIGAYVLAGELAAAGGDHTAAFRAYEREMADYVRGSRDYAARMVKQVIPGTQARIWAGAQIFRLLDVLPAGPARLLSKLADTTGLHDKVNVKRY